MIIFYNKKTGLIVGSIGGRVHGEEHLKMWLGDREENERIVINWKPGPTIETRTEKHEGFEEIGRDELDEPIYKKTIITEKINIPEFIPEHGQENLIRLFEEHPTEIYKYHIDLKTKEIKKNRG